MSTSRLTPEGVIDAASRTAGQLSLAVNRLSAGHPVEDRELQRRIDASRYPKIEGVLDQIVPSGDNGNYRVSGDITFRGVARRCDDEMTVAALDADTVQLTGKSRFDIRDFGMEPPRVLMFRMEPEVGVSVEIVAAKGLAVRRRVVRLGRVFPSGHQMFTCRSAY